MGLNRITACFKGKCPNCEEGNAYKKTKGLSIKLPQLEDRCSVCNHKFNKEPGFFQGAMYVSYGLAMAIALSTFIICQFIFEKTFDLRIFGIISVVVTLFSLKNYKYSRVIWMYLFTPKNSERART